MDAEPAEEVKDDEWAIPDDLPSDEEVDWLFRDWLAWADEALPW